MATFSFPTVAIHQDNPFPQENVPPKLAERGIKKLFVICPAFVADCLETLEEIGIRAHETFTKAGGKELALIPCLNEHPLWLDTLEKMIRAFTNPAQPQPRAEAVPTV